MRKAAQPVTDLPARLHKYSQLTALVSMAGKVQTDGCQTVGHQRRKVAKPVTALPAVLHHQTVH